ncbi:DUF4174 domain-containing protein [Echinicola sp. 20G]|uniref:DUF4174 domain-containing protein n=1 Tax=Echinicola sp. 20G TaxID=2781961 RepID=UPI0019104276|nr:DUF4174 domain-containing protein [Echinicola sp. 20G]
MNYFNLSIAFLVFGLINHLNAQELSEHQWKERLLIIMTHDLTDSTYEKQIDTLQKNLGELTERKLVVYQFNKDKFKTGLDSNKAWNKTESKKWIEALKFSNSGFEIILIGLDGQIKRRQTGYLAPKELFGTIDTMPMRRQEMKAKKHD